MQMLDASTWAHIIEILPYAGSILTGGVAFYVGKRKVKRDEDSSIFSMESRLRKELNQMNDALKEDINRLKTDLKLREAEIAELRNQIFTLKTEVVKKDQNISELKIELLQREMEINDLTKNRPSFQ